ncbi:hypothetical protein CVT25_011829 [Psilocybe cyanescens]|uniref:U6 small nuclear RNA (adenine-(43)-N(6))-methyltransferase n=1 Tax=Psilocybe cyanescens TaxID=93625 RepID=A0A409WIY8_PSICY|nr:hypothetical protein CVT25_011829 [Psilocybe cyanescens]
MHERNPYRIPPDFAVLCDSYEKLKPYIISDPASSRTTIDFKDEEAQRRLTEAIMHRDFGVTLHIPLTRLCPPVPNRQIRRLNYALWMQDIVRAHEVALGSQLRTRHLNVHPPKRDRIDRDLSFSFVQAGTDLELDDESYASAQHNVSQNNMQSRIHIEKASPDGLILFPLECNHDSFTFTMCNPPFYGSADEVAQSAQEKELPPNAVCSGAEVEMIYPDGGEEGFVGKMVEESERFQTRCKWYTSMLGKMSSVVTIVGILRQRSISNYAITEFVQGQTRRWAIAWSFTDTRLPDSLARIPSILPKHALYSCMPPRNTLNQAFPGYTIQDVHAKLGDTLRGVNGVSCNEINSMGTNSNPFLVEAQENTWSRSARRSRANNNSRKPSSALEEGMTTTAPDPALTCSCRVNIDTGLSEEDGGEPLCAIEIQWIYGKDRALFESFAGHVGRKVGSSLRTEGKGIVGF